MAQKFALDLILEEGDDYETGVREALVITEVGTNSTSTTTPIHLVIDGKPMGDLLQDLSPISKINTRFWDLLPLGSLYYVVPPETSITVSGPSGLEIRCKGYLIKLAVGEALPTNLMARFNEQPNHYYTFEYGYVDWSAGKTYADKEEVDVITYTPKTIERAVFNSRLMAKLQGWTRAVHEVAVRVYLDDAPLDFLLEKTPIGGIDIYNTPYPPAETTEHRGFTLCDFPVTVEGDHTIKFVMRNISGGDITIAAASGNGPYVAAVCEYQKIG